MVGERFEARFLGAESTASAEPESYRTPRSCLRAVTQRLEAWRGLREQRRSLGSRKGLFCEYYLNFVTDSDFSTHPRVQGATYYLKNS